MPAGRPPTLTDARAAVTKRVNPRRGVADIFRPAV